MRPHQRSAVHARGRGPWRASTPAHDAGARANPASARGQMNGRFPLPAGANPRPHDACHRRNPGLPPHLGHLPNEPELHLEQQEHQQRLARAHPSTKRTQALPQSAARPRSARALGWARYLVHRPPFNLNILTVPSTPPLTPCRAHVSEHEFSGTNPSARRGRAIGAHAFRTNELRRARDRTEATFA